MESQEAGSNATQEIQPNVAESDKTNVSDSDLMQRVSEFKVEPQAEKTVQADIFQDQELRKKIESIEDPELKQHFELLRKSAMTGLTEKFQEIAEMRKELQSLKENSNEPWTPERVKQQLNDPSWQQAAQQVSSELSNTDDYEDPKVKKLEQELQYLKKQQEAALSQQSKAQMQQEHARLQGKYRDYNSDEIDTIYLEMLENKRSSVRPNSTLLEDVYWAKNGPDNVKKAYELGRLDERSGKSDIPPSIDGIDTSESRSAPQPEKDESGESYMNRVVLNNLRKMTKRSAV